MKLPSAKAAIASLRETLRSSFEIKVVLLSVAATVSALIMSFSIFQWRDWTTDQNDLAHDQMSVAAHLAAALADPSEPSDVATARAIFFAQEHTVAATFLFDDGRRVRFARPDAPAAVPRPLGGRAASSRLHLDGVEVHLPRLAHGRRIGELILEAHNDEVRESFRLNVLVASIVSVLATVLAAGVARALARRALRPLYILNAAIEEVRRSKDFGNEVFTTSKDEFGRLADNFNALLTELKTFSSNLHQALEEVTTARDIAMKANLLKSQFLANMSHEIRTPLNGVLGMAQAMSGDELSAAQRDRLELVRRSGASLLAVLNDILDLSKIEAGFFELDEAPFDIEDIANDTCAVFASAAARKDLPFVLEIADDAKGSWRGDAGRIRQVLSNLLSNAVKFTERGEVRVQVRKENTAGSEVLAISVSDTGIGVSEENLPKLFEKFIQADSTTTRRFGGTGLGLTISRHIVELMGGTIEVESRVGVGTSFLVRAPLAWLGQRGPRHDVADELATPADLSSLRVLAAEDNETNQLVLSTLVRSFGVDMVMVADGRQAVEAWEAGNFDLILMDVQMPVLDGVAATQEIRAIERRTGRPHTRIIAVSANAMTHQVTDYLVAGMDGHVSKPIAIESLFSALADAAQSAATRTAAHAA